MSRTKQARIQSGNQKNNTSEEKNKKNVVVALCEKNKINNKTIVQYAIPFIQNIYTIFTRDGKIMGFVQALWLQCHLKVSSLKDNFFEEKR